MVTCIAAASALACGSFTKTKPKIPPLASPDSSHVLITPWASSWAEDAVVVDQQIPAGQEKVIVTLKVNLLQVDVHVLDLMAWLWILSFGVGSR